MENFQSSQQNFDLNGGYDRLGINENVVQEKMLQNPLLMIISMFALNRGNNDRRFSTSKKLELLKNLLKTRPNVRKSINEPSYKTESGVIGLYPLHNLCSFSSSPGALSALKLLIEKYGGDCEKKYLSAGFQKALLAHPSVKIPKYIKPYIGSTPILFCCKSPGMRGLKDDRISNVRIQNENERKTIKYLLKRRVNANAISQEGFSVLGCQCMNYDLELIKLALEAGANPNGFEYLVKKIGSFKKYLTFLYRIRDMEHYWKGYNIHQFVQTPLFKLVSHCKKDEEEKCLKVMKMMKHFGLNVNFPHDQLQGLSEEGAVNLQLHLFHPLHLAIERGYEKVVRWLVEEGKINLNYENSKCEKTALTETIRFAKKKGEMFLFELLWMLKRNGYKILEVDRKFFGSIMNTTQMSKIINFFSDNMSDSEFRESKTEILETILYKEEKKVHQKKKKKLSQEENERVTKEFAEAVRNDPKTREGFEQGMKWLFDRKKERAEGEAKMMKKICGQCGKKDAKKVCSRCRKVYYCSRACQVKNWKFHKQHCGTLASSNWKERGLYGR